MFMDLKFRSAHCVASSLLKWRSAIKWVVNSSYHPVVDNILVSHFITGVFHLNPSRPKAPREIWDVNVVLHYWDKQPPNKDLPLMLLTQKTLLLVLISTMKRCSEVLSMTIPDRIYRPNSIIFPLDSYPKNYSLRSRMHELCFITIRKFVSNPNICPLLAVQHYIQRTYVLRSAAVRCLFITTQHPHKPVSTMSAYRWILTGLFQAGIDVTKYSARTTRHASSSKAVFAGVNVDSVLARAGWCNLSSFVVHYNLPIEHSAKPVPVWTEKKKSPKTVYLSKINLKRSNNVKAAQLLRVAEKHLYQQITQFSISLFVDPPPIVKRQLLRNKKRVTIPAATVRA